MNPQEPTPQPAVAANGAVDWLAETLAALSWVDRAALLILVVFFVLGIVRGFVWQAGRIAILVLSYCGAVFFGPDLAKVTGSWFAESAPEQVPLFVAWALLFVAVLIVVSLLARLVQRVVERSGLTFANRIGGGVLGFASGALVVMAMLTCMHLMHDALGAGTSIVRAAERSRSQAISHQILRVTSGILPTSWRNVPDGWRALLHDPQLEPAESDSEAPDAGVEGDRERGDRIAPDRQNTRRR